MDFSLYKPSPRFETLATTELAKAMWQCLTQEANILKMEEAIARGEAPVVPLDEELHERFSDLIEKEETDSAELRVLCMNMMKQLLEQKGYQHTACAFVPKGSFVTSAGLFQKV